MMGCERAQARAFFLLAFFFLARAKPDPTAKNSPEKRRAKKKGEREFARERERESERESKKEEAEEEAGLAVWWWLLVGQQPSVSWLFGSLVLVEGRKLWERRRKGEDKEGGSSWCSQLMTTSKPSKEQIGRVLGR